MGIYVAYLQAPIHIELNLDILIFNRILLLKSDADQKYEGHHLDMTL